MLSPRRSRGAAFAALVAVAALVATAAAVLGATSQVTIQETNNQYQFTPGAVTVNVGDTVHWQNGSDAPHTVSSDSGSDLDGSIDANTGTYDKTFDAAGTFKYHCDIHSYMHGTIVVRDASTGGGGGGGGATQPPTDTATSRPRDGSGSPYTLLLVLALAAGVGGALALRRLTRSTEPADPRD